MRDDKCILLLLCLSLPSVVWTQRVRVLDEVEGYANDSVYLRCAFNNPGDINFTQVSWEYSGAVGQRAVIAVFDSVHKEAYPVSSLSGRVQFTRGSIESPSIRIDNLQMSDAGRYTCTYTIYPAGKKEGVTTLKTIAKPENSASPIAVKAGSAAAVVARCYAAKGKPAAEITWETSLIGSSTNTSWVEVDGTVTVKSEYHLVPTLADNGRKISCVVAHYTLDEPQIFPMELQVEYLPSVKIEGYDDNWYMGRTNAILTCQVDANPAPTRVTWTVASGVMPATVRVEHNQLLVQKVDESVNTIFVCKASNKLGTGKSQLTVTVTSKCAAGQSSLGGSALLLLTGILVSSR